MVKVKTPIFATDQHDNEVLVMPSYEISEITDAGPIDDPRHEFGFYVPIGWRVAFRITNREWTDLVTCDAIKLLKALEEAPVGSMNNPKRGG